MTRTVESPFRTYDGELGTGSVIGLALCEHIAAQL